MPPEWLDTKQRATYGRDGVEAAHLRAEVPLDDGPDPVLDLLGEGRVPLGGLFLADGVNVRCGP